jgi:hypothetical protein
MGGQGRERGQGAAILLGLFVLAFAVRIIGVDYGYFHGDERVNDAARVLTGQLVPGQHFYPPLLNYLNGIAFGLLYAGGRVLGVWPDTGAFRAQYFTDPTVFHITARLVTAALGAAVAPLFYIAARGLRLPVWPALAVGVLGVLLPIAVYQSHIAKGDVPLATATVLVICALLRRHQPGAGVWQDVALGASAVLALSFKQSFLFILLPLVVGHGWLLWRAGGAVVRSFAVALAVAAVLWPVLNIGILLDFQSFLEYQRIQSVMSVADGSVGEALALWAARGVSAVQGITPVSFALGALFPLWLASPRCTLPQKPLLACVWGALALSTLLMLGLVGARQPEHLWLPQFAGMHLLAALAIGDLMRRGRAGVALWAGTVALAIYGAVVVSQQALAPPIRDELQALLTRRYADRHILTGVTLTLPQAEKARAEDVARLQRLAQKYGVTLPDEAPERAAPVPGAALFYRPTPPVMFGLEDAKDEDVQGVVQAHAWPLQAEEWVLDAWLAQGVDLFVASDLDYALHDTPSRLFRAFWSDVVARCATVAEIAPRKPLFLERKVTVLDCATPG